MREENKNVSNPHEVVASSEPKQLDYLYSSGDITIGNTIVRRDNIATPPGVNRSVGIVSMGGYCMREAIERIMSIEIPPDIAVEPANDTTRALHTLEHMTSTDKVDFLNILLYQEYATAQLNKPRLSIFLHDKKRRKRKAHQRRK